MPFFCDASAGADKNADAATTTAPSSKNLRRFIDLFIISNYEFLNWEMWKYENVEMKKASIKIYFKSKPSFLIDLLLHTRKS